MVCFAEYQFYEQPVFFFKFGIVKERQISTQDFGPRGWLLLRQRMAIRTS